MLLLKVPSRFGGEVIREALRDSWTTGGGKSWTTARIIEECLKHKAKIILLDATGSIEFLWPFGGSLSPWRSRE